jgi:hypothetical protein
MLEKYSKEANVFVHACMHMKKLEKRIASTRNAIQKDRDGQALGS